MYIIAENLKQYNCCWKKFPNYWGRPCVSYLTKDNQCLGFLKLPLFILSWIRFVTMLLILQLDQWPNKVETKTATLFVPVYQYPSHPPLPSSDLCHNLSAYSHTPALIYISWITSGPCCTLGTLLHFLTGPTPVLFPLDVVCFQPVSFHLSVCLSLKHPVPSSFSLFSIPLFPFLLICCVYMCLNSLYTLS